MRDIAIGVMELPLVASGTAASPIVLAPGATIRGRVVDARGIAVPEASVTLALTDGVAIQWATSAEGGEFELPIDFRGEACILAQKEDQGSAFLSPVALVPDEDVALPDLVLMGTGRIAGLVVFPDGAPVPNASIEARHESLPVEDANDYRGRLSAEASGSGFSFARTRSSPDGRFGFGALRPGLYALSVSDARLRGRGPVTVPAETGDLEARIVLEWTRIHLRVFEPSGEQAESAGIDIVGWGPEGRASFESAVAAGKGPKELFDQGDFASSQGGRGETIEFAPRGGFLLVRASTYGPESDAGPNFADAAIEVPLEGNELTFDLVPKPVENVGRLRVAIREASGRPIPEYVASLEGEGGLNFPFTRRRPDENGLLPAVLPGKYRLDVEPGRFLEQHYLPVEVDVVIEAGRETEVPIVAVAGGRLNLTLSVTGAKPGISSFQAEVTVLSDAGDVVEEVGAFFRLTDGGYSWATAIEANEATFAGRVLAPGNYRVRAEAPGFEPAEAAFVAEAGSAADVTLELARRN